MSAGLAALEPLVALLTPTELRRVAASLELSGRPSRAAREVTPARQPAASDLLTELTPAFGDPRALAASLRVVASTVDRHPEPPVLVWSGPRLGGDAVRTTDTIVRLIDEAEESVHASTYSGSSAAPFVQALQRAAARKVAIRVVVDVVNQREDAQQIAKAVPRAEMLGYHHQVDGVDGLQHSKVLVIDGQVSLVTSANLSKAAIERNLEAGLLVHDARVASQIIRRFDDLLASGFLLPIQAR